MSDALLWILVLLNSVYLKGCLWFNTVVEPRDTRTVDNKIKNYSGLSRKSVVMVCFGRFLVQLGSKSGGSVNVTESQVHTPTVRLKNRMKE